MRAFVSTIPKRCPACGQDMQVCVLRCTSCQTEVQGKYALDRFALLSEEQLAFLETFLRCRGSLKDVGAEIGVSYPTARNRLDDLLGALDFDGSRSSSRMNILNKVKSGELTAHDALALLQKGDKQV